MVLWCCIGRPDTKYTDKSSLACVVTAPEASKTKGKVADEHHAPAVKPSSIDCDIQLSEEPKLKNDHSRHIPDPLERRSKDDDFTECKASPGPRLRSAPDTAMQQHIPEEVLRSEGGEASSRPRQSFDSEDLAKVWRPGYGVGGHRRVVDSFIPVVGCMPGCICFDASRAVLDCNP